MVRTIPRSHSLQAIPWGCGGPMQDEPGLDSLRGFAPAECKPSSRGFANGPNAPAFTCTKPGTQPGSTPGESSSAAATAASQALLRASRAGSNNTCPALSRSTTISVPDSLATA